MTQKLILKQTHYMILIQMVQRHWALNAVQDSNRAATMH